MNESTAPPSFPSGSDFSPIPFQPPASSPFKKLIPFIIIVIVLTLLTGILAIFLGKSSGPKVSPAPTLRPTATPYPPPTIPMITQTAVSITPATISATISPAVTKLGRLAFIKDGDIYHTDLAAYTLLVKNDTPAGDRLSWSPEGNFLAWRPKSSTAAPSFLSLYSREKNSVSTIRTTSNSQAEVLDYAWSPDETQVAVLFHDKSYSLTLYSTASPSSQQAVTLINKTSIVKQLIWSEKKAIIYSNEEGIGKIETDNPETKLLISDKNIQNIKLAPSGKKLLVASGDSKKSDLYIIAPDGSGRQELAAVPPKVNMGTTGLSSSVLDKGFISYAVWFPGSDKLMVGYHYLTNLPLVGIYSLTDASFTAVAVTTLYDSDIMTDDYRMLGERVNTTSGSQPVWQISYLTMEDNANLAVIRVIPGAHTPAFFGKNVEN